MKKGIAIDKPAPEEDFVPEPQSFPDRLTYLSTTYEEEIKEYEGLLEKHVSSDRREKTDILKLLLSKDKLVFVPGSV